MDACGFPSPDTTGVPAGTTLTPSGSITVSRPGKVINGLAVIGHIDVTANDVTIENSDIADADTSGNPAIRIESGVTGTVIKYTSIHGTGTGSNALSIGVETTEGTPASALDIDHVYFYNGDRLLQEGGTVTNSFAINNVDISGGVNGGGVEHYETTYQGGGSSTFNHDTFINVHNQTAVIYWSVDSGYTFGALQVTNSLLVGGGYTIYGCQCSTLGSLTITGNRFSRLYYPRAGYYGPVTDMPTSSPYTWSGNVWDDTGQPVKP